MGGEETGGERRDDVCVWYVNCGRIRVSIYSTVDKRLETCVGKIEGSFGYDSVW